jgi:hypothetical protein
MSVPSVLCPLGPTRLNLPHLAQSPGSHVPWVPPALPHRIWSNPQGLLSHGSHSPYPIASSTVSSVYCPMGPTPYPVSSNPACRVYSPMGPTHRVLPRLVRSPGSSGPWLSWLQTQRSWVQFPALPNFLSNLSIQGLSGPRCRPAATQKIWQRRESNPGPLR